METKLTKHEEALTAVLGLAAAFTACSAGQMVLFYILTVCAAFDLKARTIPGRFQIAAVLAWVCFELAEAWPTVSVPALGVRLIWSSIGVFMIVALLILVTLLYEKLRHRKAIGGGDIKLFFIIALFLGVDKTLTVMMISCVIAIAFAALSSACPQTSKTPDPFPWAPAIALASMISAVV